MGQTRLELQVPTGLTADERAALAAEFAETVIAAVLRIVAPVTFAFDRDDDEHTLSLTVLYEGEDRRGEYHDTMLPVLVANITAQVAGIAE